MNELSDYSFSAHTGDAEPQIEAVEADDVADRLRRAREELAAAERAAADSRKRKRVDDGDDKTAIRRKLENQMTEALKAYDGETIDLSRRTISNHIDDTR